MNVFSNYASAGTAIAFRTFTSNIGVGFLWTAFDTVNSWFVAPLIGSALYPLGAVGDLLGTTYANMVTLAKLNVWNAIAPSV